MEFLSDLSTILIALIALGLTIWQARTTQKHNRLSLKPHLMFDVRYDNESPQIHIILKNSGVGPAYVTDYSVTLDGNPYTGSMLELRKRLDLPDEPDTYGGGFIPAVGDAIQQNESIDCFILKTKGGDRDPNFDNEKAHEQVSRLDFVVKYQSAYEEEDEKRLQDKGK